MLHCNNVGEALDHLGWRDLMAGLGVNLTNSVTSVGRKLLRMMDALAETGMRHAHREISRGQEIDAEPLPQASAQGKRKRGGRDGAVH